jgi:hypothetical protein
MDERNLLEIAIRGATECWLVARKISSEESFAGPLLECMFDEILKLGLIRTNAHSQAISRASEKGS